MFMSSKMSFLYNDETSRHDFNLVFLLLEDEIFGLAISREN